MFLRGASRVSDRNLEARQWSVRGTVQGVGFRWFVARHAKAIGLTGWARNLDDGTVSVYAVGEKKQLDILAGLLHQGPQAADVRGVEEREAAVQQLNSFRTG